jgi:hypothetical protein
VGVLLFDKTRRHVVPKIIDDRKSPLSAFRPQPVTVIRNTFRDDHLQVIAAAKDEHIDDSEDSRDNEHDGVLSKRLMLLIMDRVKYNKAYNPCLGYR